MKTTLTLFIFLFGAIAESGMAATTDELSRYFRSELERVDAIAADEPLTNPAIPGQDINIDVSPTVSFGVSGIFQLTVAPEMDFVLVPDKQ
jgi:hypothetical protein